MAVKVGNGGSNSDSYLANHDAAALLTGGEYTVCYSFILAGLVAGRYPFACGKNDSDDSPMHHFQAAGPGIVGRTRGTGANSGVVSAAFSLGAWALVISTFKVNTDASGLDARSISVNNGIGSTDDSGVTLAVLPNRLTLGAGLWNGPAFGFCDDFIVAGFGLWDTFLDGTAMTALLTTSLVEVETGNQLCITTFSNPDGVLTSEVGPNWTSEGTKNLLLPTVNPPALRSGAGSIPSLGGSRLGGISTDSRLGSGIIVA